MKFFLKSISYLLVALAASLLTLLWLPRDEPSKLEQLKALILERYIGGAEQTALEDAAANAMVAATGDRWSYYIPAAEYQAYLEQMSNSYVGIGVTIQLAEDGRGFLVTKVNEGGSAEAAGVLAGDLILALDGQRAAGMTTGEARNLVRGQEGTSVELTLERQGREVVLPVERRTVNTPVATGQLLPGNVGLVRIENFDRRCAQESIQAIKDLTEQGATALILDVRNNPGGYADEMVKVLDHLLPEGQLFKTVDYAGNTHVDTSDAACLDIPMAVLVNRESYSAAEFFAAALRDYDAALVVGEKTSGKGYFQVNYRLSDGSAVSLSIGQYFTPQGANLAGVGVEPDVAVAVEDDTFVAIYAGTLDPARDPQLQAALAALTGEASPHP